MRGGSDKMKYLILGANGMAGHMISTYLIEKGYDVTTLTKSPYLVGKNIILDVRDFGQLKSIIHQDFDVIINAIGLLNRSVDDYLSDAILINSYLPHFLQDQTKNTNTKVIHLSTDCVFSGLTGSYKETSLKDGLSYYAMTKNLGEISGSKDLTIRTSIIGPDINPSGIGLFNWFMKQKQPIKGYERAIWTGVTTLTLAKAIEVASQNEVSGLYHLVNSETISKYDLLQLFNQYFKASSLHISKDDQYHCDKSLVCTRKDFVFDVPSYEQMIIEMKQWIDEHHELYPHYFDK